VNISRLKCKSVDKGFPNDSTFYYISFDLFYFKLVRNVSGMRKTAISKRTSWFEIIKRIWQGSSLHFIGSKRKNRKKRRIWRGTNTTMENLHGSTWIKMKRLMQQLTRNLWSVMISKPKVIGRSCEIAGSLLHFSDKFDRLLVKSSDRKFYKNSIHLSQRGVWTVVVRRALPEKERARI